MTQHTKHDDRSIGPVPQYPAIDQAVSQYMKGFEAGLAKGQPPVVAEQAAIDKAVSEYMKGFDAGLAEGLRRTASQIPLKNPLETAAEAPTSDVGTQTRAQEVKVQKGRASQSQHQSTGPSQEVSGEQLESAALELLLKEGKHAADRNHPKRDKELSSVPDSQPKIAGRPPIPPPVTQHTGQPIHLAPYGLSAEPKCHNPPPSRTPYPPTPRSVYCGPKMPYSITEAGYTHPYTNSSGHYPSSTPAERTSASHKDGPKTKDDSAEKPSQPPSEKPRSRQAEENAHGVKALRPQLAIPVSKLRRTSQQFDASSGRVSPISSDDNVASEEDETEIEDKSAPEFLNTDTLAKPRVLSKYSGGKAPRKQLATRVPNPNFPYNEEPSSSNDSSDASDEDDTGANDTSTHPASKTNGLRIPGSNRLGPYTGTFAPRKQLATSTPPRDTSKQHASHPSSDSSEETLKGDKKGLGDYSDDSETAHLTDFHKQVLMFKQAEKKRAAEGTAAAWTVAMGSKTDSGTNPGLRTSGKARRGLRRLGGAMR